VLSLAAKETQFVQIYSATRQRKEKEKVLRTREYVPQEDSISRIHYLLDERDCIALGRVEKLDHSRIFL